VVFIARPSLIYEARKCTDSHKERPVRILLLGCVNLLQ